MNLLPSLDLNSLAPIAGLAAIAVVCIGALLLRSILHSRIALLIAVVIGVVAAGPALANALSNIVWALVPLTVVLIAGGIAAIWLLGRNPDLLDVARDLVPRQEHPVAPPPLELPEPNSAIVINQSNDSKAVTHRPARKPIIIDNDRWGF